MPHHDATRRHLAPASVMRQAEFLRDAEREAAADREPSLLGLVIGFGILLILLVAVATISLSRMADNQARLEYVLDRHVAKLELITQMRHTARERTIALQKLMLLDDPFVQDEVFLAFNRYGAQFAGARQAYIALGLSPEEQAVLDAQGAITGWTVPAQRRIADLAMEGKADEARALFIDQALPGQDAVFTELDRLHHMQRAAAEQARRVQTETYTGTRSTLVALVVLVILAGIAVAWVAITRTRRYQAALFAAKERASVTLGSIGDAVVATDRRGRLDYLNPCAEELLGYALAECRQRPLSEIVTLYDDSTDFDFEPLFTQTLSRGEFYTGSRDLRLDVNHVRQLNVEITASPIHDRRGTITGTVIVLRDVTELRALDQELTYQAAHDSLTGLLNRREFEHRVEEALREARGDDSQHALCYIDLDMFKVVNDTHGHVAGDELLRQLAMLLIERVRRGDTVARLGGDEFGLLLPYCDLSKAEALAGQLLRTIESFRFHWEDHSFKVGASIGLVPIRPDSGTLGDVIQAADFACYCAKEAGRNQIYVSDSEGDLVGRRRGEARWVQRLNAALGQDQFELYFQSLEPLREDVPGPRCIELLLRLREGGELVAPMAFMPAAERYHLMPAVDRWVIAKTLATMQRVTVAGCDTPHVVNINLSGQTLSDPGFLDFVLEEVQKTDLGIHRLCFEITETAAISHLSRAIRVMNTLRGLGCYFALDDFGSGLSSFAYLKSLPVDYVKIDGMFVRDLDEDPAHRAMVRSIAEIAGVMGIGTVAEFVETQGVRDRLVELGVDFGQGYFFGHPEPLEAYVDRLCDQRGPGHPGSD